MIYNYCYPLQNGAGVEGSLPGRHDHTKTDCVDIATAEGTLVYAITDGVITVVDDTVKDNRPGSTGNAFAGTYIVLKFNQDNTDYYVTYMHLSEINVKEKQTVAAGQVIGKSGNTGNSSGPHLHIQIRKGDYWGSSSQEVERPVNLTKEDYRINPTGQTLPFTQKLFRYLAVKENTGIIPPLQTVLTPTNKLSTYYTEVLDSSVISEEEVSILSQLCINELGTKIYNSNNQTLMDYGLYAKLLRTIYFLYRQNYGPNIFNVLKRKGGFSGWADRGYPKLNEGLALANDIKDIVYKNLMNGDIYKLEGKFFEIANCYPHMNYGYSGVSTLDGNTYDFTSKYERELENRILTLDSGISSHLKTYPNTTRLIGCIANTAFFTSTEVTSNLISICSRNERVLDIL